MSVFRSARALSRYGPWTATSTFAPIEWSVIVPGAGVGRTKKPKVVRHPPTMWRGGTTISPGFGIRHRAVATCCSGIMSCRCLRDHLGGLGSPVGRSARYVDQIATQYDHGEGSEGLERHIRRSARFLYPRRLLTLRRGAAYQQSGPTTSDMAERFTGPCRECMEWLGEMGPSADDVYSCFAGCTSRALESGALPLTSASSRGRQSVNARWKFAQIGFKFSAHRPFLGGIEL